MGSNHSATTGRHRSEDEDRGEKKVGSRDSREHVCNMNLRQSEPASITEDQRSRSAGSSVCPCRHEELDRPRSEVLCNSDGSPGKSVSGAEKKAGPETPDHQVDEGLDEPDTLPEECNHSDLGEKASEARSSSCPSSEYQSCLGSGYSFPAKEEEEEVNGPECECDVHAPAATAAPETTSSASEKMEEEKEELRPAEIESYEHYWCRDSSNPETEREDVSGGGGLAYARTADAFLESFADKGGEAKEVGRQKSEAASSPCSGWYKVDLDDNGQLERTKSTEHIKHGEDMPTGRTERSLFKPEAEDWRRKDYGPAERPKARLSCASANDGLGARKSEIEFRRKRDDVAGGRNSLFSINRTASRSDCRTNTLDSANVDKSRLLQQIKRLEREIIVERSFCRLYEDQMDRACNVEDDQHKCKVSRTWQYSQARLRELHRKLNDCEDVWKKLHKE